MRKVFGVDINAEGTLWVHGEEVTALREKGKWRKGIPTAHELATEFTYFHNPPVAMAIVVDALKALNIQEVKDIDLEGAPLGVGIRSVFPVAVDSYINQILVIKAPSPSVPRLSRDRRSVIEFSEKGKEPESRKLIGIGYMYVSTYTKKPNIRLKFTGDFQPGVSGLVVRNKVTTELKKLYPNSRSTRVGIFNDGTYEVVETQMPLPVKKVKHPLYGKTISRSSRSTGARNAKKPM